MNYKHGIATGFILVTTAVIACQIKGNLVTPPMQPSTWSTVPQKWRKIGSMLDALYQGAWKNYEIITVRVPVSQCMFGVCGETVMTFEKPCNKTLDETLNEMADSLEEALAGGPSGGGGVGPGGGGGDRPHPGNNPGAPLFPTFDPWYRSCAWFGDDFAGCSVYQDGSMG